MESKTRETSSSTTCWLTIEMIGFTGVAPWEFEFSFSGSLTCAFLVVQRSFEMLTPSTNEPQLPNPHFYLTQRVFKVVFAKVSSPHRFVNLSFTITDIENKLTNMNGN